MTEVPQGDSSSLPQLLEQAVVLMRKRRFAEASPLLNRALELDPSSFDALNLAGVAANSVGRSAEAVTLLERAALLRPEHFGVHNNLGIALRAVGRHEEAAAAYERAVELQPDYAPAHANRGATLADLKRYAEALECHDRSLELRPGHPDTLVQRALVLRRLRLYTEALQSLDRALAVAPTHAEAHYERGNCLRSLDRFGEALAAHERALSLESGEPRFVSAVMMSRLRACDWTGIEGLIGEVVRNATGGAMLLNPFSSLAVVDDGANLLEIARRWCEHEFKFAAPPVIRAASQRIHLAYFSADFRNHPMMHLMGELFDLRDRDRFKVSAFAFNVGEGDEYTARARAAVDAYIDVDGLSDADVASLARQLEVDIAIDRKGYTKGARTGIFAARAAPIQVSYLAYPGTMGAPFIDYLIADRIIVPPATLEHYSEKIVWMPDSYAPRDTRVEVPVGRITREAAGLPRDQFVFCSFNQSYKILPAAYSEWMSILRKVEGSILWLLDSGEVASRNLRREADARGVAPERLVFAPRCGQVEHLERLRLADLCLDTLPYNAHTTANDALYVGVPIITRPGSSFASRVCASLLHAMDMAELVAGTSEEYVELAVRLASNPAQLAGIRSRLSEAKSTAPLYDMPKYVAALERAFVMMFERHQRGLAPDHLSVNLG